MNENVIDGEDFTRSLNGFEEMAIKRMFGSALGDLDGSIVPRALLFVEAKRNGQKDPDAFRAVMEMRLGDVEERFVDPEAAEEDPEGKASGTTHGGTSSS